MRFPANGSETWQVRVVANKFAALSLDIQPTRTIHRSPRSMGGFGVHEAIIDTPDHSHSIAQMSDAHVANVLRVDKSRYDALSLDHRIAHVTIYYDEYGECMFCQSREEEIADRQRVLLLTEHFVALELYASPTPFCTPI